MAAQKMGKKRQKSEKKLLEAGRIPVSAAPVPSGRDSRI
jgi:hypothetical protein